MKQKNKKKPLIVACLLIASSVSTQADILTDGTVGDIYYLFGDNMIIPQSYGTTVGNNLFHSFAMFNIYSGEAVTFTGANTLENVIARVTGGDASMINGVLSSNIGKANFYFINPAGVTFSKNAVVDVPASFHVSTANQINFSDGSVYSATNPAASTLTVAKPESFGFLGQTGDIVLDGAQIIVKPNQTIDLVANNITLKNQADLYAPAGEVRLVAAKGSQNVSLVRDENGFLPLPSQMPNSENAGNILIENSVIDTTGNGGGLATLWGGDVLLTNSLVFADNNGFLNAGIGKGINIRANLLSLDSSLITADAYNQLNPNVSGDAGNVFINAGKIDIFDGGLISSSTYTAGNAGNVNVNSNQLKIDGQQSRHFTGIASVAGRNSRGNAGNIIIKAGNIEIFSGGEISSSTFSQGNAGYINITANQLKIDGQKSRYFTGINSQTVLGNGNAGNIVVNAGDISILDGGEISSNTFSQGNAGNVNISTSQLKIDGQESINLTGITSDTFQDKGNAGNIIVKADSIEILGGGTISSSTFSQGNANNVNITANQLKIDAQDNSDFTGIASQANSGTGNAGNIIIKAGNIELLNNGIISSTTFSQGKGGSVYVVADTITLDRGYIEAVSVSSGKGGDISVSATKSLIASNESFITSYSVAEGSAGNVNVLAPLISLDNSHISAATLSLLRNPNGQTGNVTVTATQELNLTNNALISIQNEAIVDNPNAFTPTTLTVNAPRLNLTNSAITAASTGNTNASNIHINSGVLSLQDSSITTSANANGNGGDININSDVLVMDTGLIQANAESGQGGDINLNVQTLIPSYNSLIVGGEQIPWQPYIQGFNVIQAASANGVNGTVNISSPQFDISGSISGLKTNSLEPPTMSRSPCNLSGSSLKRKGKGGIPANEAKQGFIPPVTKLSAYSNKPVLGEPQNILSSQANQPCKASTI